MKAKNKLFPDLVMVVDGNHALHRAYWKFRNMRNRKGTVTSMIYGLPFILKSLLVKYGPDKVVVVFDGGRNKKRMKLLPTYKAREQKLGFDLENFKEQKDVVIELLQSLGVTVIMQRYQEADDLIYWVCRKNFRKGFETLIISGDKDFKQLINPSVSIFDPNKDSKFTIDNAEVQLGIKPKQVVDYLCLTGDDSDKIPGYPGIGDVYAKDFLKRYSSIKKFLHTKDSYRNIDKAKLETIWKLNKQLIDLRFFYLKYVKRKNLPLPILNPNPKVKVKALKKICEKYNLRSFLLDDFIRPFKNLSRYGT